MISVAALLLAGGASANQVLQVNMVPACEVTMEDGGSVQATIPVRQELLDGGTLVITPAP